MILTRFAPVTETELGDTVVKKMDLDVSHAEVDGSRHANGSKLNDIYYTIYTATKELPSSLIQISISLTELKRIVNDLTKKE